MELPPVNAKNAISPMLHSSSVEPGTDFYLYLSKQQGWQGLYQPVSSSLHLHEQLFTRAIREQPKTAASCLDSRGGAGTNAFNLVVCFI